jgi:hypothetical protein
MFSVDLAEIAKAADEVKRVHDALAGVETGRLRHPDVPLEECAQNWLRENQTLLAKLAGVDAKLRKTVSNHTDIDEFLQDLFKNLGTPR